MTTFTIRTQAEQALDAIRDRAYRAMYLAEQKFGHGSAAHRVAWTVFCDARGDEAAPRAYADAAAMGAALDVVLKACGPRGRENVALRELAARPHTMGAA